MAKISRAILCVDDEPNVVNALKRQLRRQYDIAIASSGREGLLLLQQDGPFAVVVADYNMPEMNGVEFLREVHRLTPDTVTVMLTAMAKLDVAVSALHEGHVYRFLTKPWERQDLVKTPDDCLEQYRLAMERKRFDSAFEESQQAIIRAARIDALMGICNRDTFDDYHADLHQRSTNSGVSYALLLADADNFKNTACTVGPSFFSLYAHSTLSVQLNSSGPYPLDADISRAELSGAWNIFDVVTRARDTLEPIVSGELDSVHVSWPAGNHPIYHPVPPRIELPPPIYLGDQGDEFDDDVILHEYGHHMLWKTADYWPSPFDHTFGGNHGEWTAFSEGVPDFLSCLLNGRPWFLDTTYSSVEQAFRYDIDIPGIIRIIGGMEDPLQEIDEGPGVEAAVAAALWDIYAGDVVQRDKILTVLSVDFQFYHQDIWFFRALWGDRFGSTADIDPILAIHTICPPGDMNGDGYVDEGDIPPFAEDLLDGRGRGEQSERSDLNCDGSVDGHDIQRFVDILLGAGVGPDCNGNLIPDECDADCNDNGAPDDCDIAEGTSEDCQPNGVPDECDVAEQDCNANGTPDDCDIAQGTSQDCQPNGIPDECEVTEYDCNENGIPDDCDIADGTSQDSNANGIPDECEHEGAGMVSVPGGEFEMGDPWSEGVGDELPVHTVYLSPYYIDTYEVTNQQYADGLNWAWAQGGLIQVNGGVVYKAGDSEQYCDTYSANSNSRIHWDGATFTVTPGREDHPMIEVSWYGSVAYCNWWSAMEGRPLCYDLETWTCDFGVAGYRLPTEAEWEKAAGWDPDQQRHFRFGEHTDGCGYICLDGQRANYAVSGDPFESGPYPWTTPAGYYDGTDHGGAYQTENAQCYYGAYDMSGNVWDWCHDWYSSTYYSSSPSSNPTGPASGSGRVARGGGWIGDPSTCRSANRNNNTPDNRNNNNGFRCAVGSLTRMRTRMPTITVAGSVSGESEPDSGSSVVSAGDECTMRPAGTCSDCPGRALS